MLVLDPDVDEPFVVLVRSRNRKGFLHILLPEVLDPLQGVFRRRRSTVLLAYLDRLRLLLHQPQGEYERLALAGSQLERTVEHSQRKTRKTERRSAGTDTLLDSLGVPETAAAPEEQELVTVETLNGQAAGKKTRIRPRLLPLEIP